MNTGTDILAIGGRTVLALPEAGPSLCDDRDASDLISAAWEAEATVILLPAGRLCDDFFRLATGCAGHMVQKLANYRLHLVVAGAPPASALRSDALRAFIVEANRGGALWFVADRAELERRLTAG